jgi:cytochrome c peroxidase
MKTKLIQIGAAIFLFSIVIACQKQESIETTVSENITKNTRIEVLIPNLPAIAYNYVNVILPAHLTNQQVIRQINTPNNNPITDNGATLGRVLFYDKNLSLNNTTSCASCHSQSKSFSDSLQFSKGFNGGITTRNSMSLLNARYYQNGRFFWDERAASAEAQASQPIVHPVEMGLTMPVLLARLKALEYYPGLFQKAYNSPTIDSTRIVRSLAQFVRSMVSYRTKYDIGRATLRANQTPNNATFSNFTALENQGMQLFFNQGNCSTCHTAETFSAPGPRNNGLDIVSVDRGVGGVTGAANQNGLFKVPSLRGIEKSAPYMHDGRFTTLEQVVEHYNSQVKTTANLSPQLRVQNGQPRRLNLSQTQKAALVSFLKTLTDTGIASDAKFSDPFK